MSGAEIVTLGCRLNIAESERLRALLADSPDTVVINSCAVTAEAVRQTRKAIRRLRRSRPDARLLVTGCAAEVERTQIAAMAEVDGIVANTAKLDPRSWNAPAPASPAAASPTILAKAVRTRAFIAVQNGCDHACTFCVIPQGRGRSRSLSVGEVLRAVGEHLDQGAREIVLTGVDVTSWGHDLPNSPALGVLVSAILRDFPTLQRLRLSSIDGAEMDPVLAELIACEPRMMPHVHLSLQSGDDMILKRMKRRHSRAQAIALVEQLRAARPELAVGADLLAGFPTETEAMHANNLSIIEACGIVHGHIFPYSPRPGTPAARMPQVPPAVARARAAQLRSAVAEVRASWLDSLIGSVHRVLAEKDGTGHAENFARFRLPDGASAGTLINMRAKAVDGGLVLGSIA